MQNKYCSRADRLGELIHKELASIIVKYCQDPRLDNLTITNVKLSKDLSLAKIYFTNKLIIKDKLIKDDSVNKVNNIKQILNILKNASTFLRCTLAKTICLRKIPELKFFYDEDLEYSLKMELLLSKL